MAAGATEVRKARQKMRKFLRQIVRPGKVGQPLSAQTLTDHVWVEAGSFDLQKFTLFSIFRDEMYFCAAFFDHYRSIGVEQFLIVDDRSTDGTSEFLRSQPDCVVLKSTYAFGEKIDAVMLDGSPVRERAGMVFKCLIPHHFCLSRFSLYADADEFLILPPGVPDLQSVVGRLRDRAFRAAAAQLVEFFPARLPDWTDRDESPSTFDDLIGRQPYFEPDVLVRVDDAGRIKKFGKTKSELLFETHNVRRKFRLGVSSARPTSPRLKVPLVKHDEDFFRTGTHSVNGSVCPDITLVMAHFVWTDDFLHKVARAIELRAYSKGSIKYVHYRDLLTRIERSGGSLLGQHSRKFGSARDLLDLRILVWR